MTLQNTLETLVGLVIYLLGVPTLVLQFAPPEVQQIWQHSPKRYRRLVSLAMLPGVLAGLCVLCVLIVPQCAVFLRIIVAVLLVLSISLSVGVICVANRTSLLKGFQRRLHKHRGFEETLEQLGILGRESMGGEAKQKCIQVLDRFVQHRLAQDDYTGDQLCRPIGTLTEIVLESAQQPTPANLRQAAHVLKRILEHPSPAASHGDRIEAVHALSLLGQQALHFPLSGVVTEIIDMLREDMRKGAQVENNAVSQALREVGTAALKKCRFTPAYATLDALEQAILQAPQEAGLEVMADYLGLLAKFWALGESGQHLVRRSLKEIESLDWFNLPQQLQRAGQHHRATLRLDLADAIRAMASALRSEKHPSIYAVERENSG